MLTEFGLQGTNSLVSDKDTQGIIMKYQNLQKGGGGGDSWGPPALFH